MSDSEKNNTAPAVSEKPSLPGVPPTAGSSRKDPSKAAKPPQASVAKAIAMIVCVLLFIAIIVVLATRWRIISKRIHHWFEPGVVTYKLPDETKEMMDEYEKAEKFYPEAIEQSKSDKLEELREAQQKLTECRDAWAKVNEFGYTFDGFEEKRGIASMRLADTIKEYRELNEKIIEKENQQRREEYLKKKKEEEQAKTEAAPVPTPPPQPAPAVNKGELDEEAYKKMEQNDPSEYERYTKLIQQGKIKLKPKQ